MSDVPATGTPTAGVEIDVEVVVVGAGPVGCVLALLLADRGRSVALVERHPAPYPLPRAVHFDDEAGRILQAVGLGEALPLLSEPAAVYEWQNGDGVPLLRFGLEGPGRSGWPTSSFFNQPDLEARLNARVEAHPRIDVRRGHRAVAVEDRGDHVVLVAEARGADDATGSGGATGGPVTIRGRYLVGCDGANSFVRSVLDPPIEDHGFFFDWLIVDVELTEPRRFEPANLQVCDPRRPTTVISGGPGRRRWEFMCLPGEDLHALDEEARAWELLEPWDVTPANATMVRHAGYRFQARWATSWHDGRVFLAGDAAHQTPPFAGQGMCAGLRDAANLAWKLDHVLAQGLVGAAAEALLATYETERLPHAARVIGMAIELGRVICVPDPDEAAARDAAMAPAVTDGAFTEAPGMGGIGPGLLAGDTPGAGELFVQGRVADGGETGRFDDVVAPGWSLVGMPDTVASLPADLSAWFAALGGSIVAVTEDAEPASDPAAPPTVRMVADADGTYRSWLAAHGVTAALQRPDFYVFGTAGTADGAGALLARLRADLPGGTAGS